MAVSLKQVVVLGSTGSIGVSTLDVVSQHPDRFQVFALVAHRSVDVMYQQCLEHRPLYAGMVDERAARELEARLRQAGSPVVVLHKPEEINRIAALDAVDYVMAAIVGAAGLLPTLAAARAGKRILLANKESLVMAGHLFMAEVANSGAELLPIDSEHNAIYQCLDPVKGKRVAGASVRRILLTASGGPFRGYTDAQLQEVSPEQAVAHPNWSMGQKISVDSATLMNKGLELIEACWLFDVPPSRIDVHVHPESIIHSMVEYLDGSILAQLGAPDMRTPIAYGLGYPERLSSNVSSLNFFELGKLTFEAPDRKAFPALDLAAQAFNEGGSGSAVLNAANEVAVAAFLKGSIRFTDIAYYVSKALSDIPQQTPESIEHILEIDRETRTSVATWIGQDGRR